MSNQQFTWHSVAVTDTGMVRSINEDSILDRSEIGLWVVADGMGGHDAGDLASQTIVKSLADMYQPPFMEAYVEAVQERLRDINNELRDIATARNNNSTIGSTVALLLAFKDRCAVLWAGDSRVYRLRGNSFQAMSKDHSQVQELVDQGVIAAQDAEAHPAANVITRAVGAMDDLEVDVNSCDLQDNDHYLICSDGLYKEVVEQEIRQAMHQCIDSAVMVKELIELAKSRNARDNVSIISVIFRAENDFADGDQTLPFFSLSKWKSKIKSD